MRIVAAESTGRISLLLLFLSHLTHALAADPTVPGTKIDARGYISVPTHDELSRYFQVGPW